jgi:outer membrane protein assembly factor BamB
VLSHRTTISCRFFAPTTVLLTLAAGWSPATAATDAASQILLPGLRWLVDISAAPAFSPMLADSYVYLSLAPGIVSAHRVKDGMEAWRVQLAADQEMASAPQRVFVPASEAVHALDADSGREVWLAPTGTVTAPLLVQSGWLIVVSGEMLSAFRAADGTRVWTRQAGEVRERPTIDGDALYVSFTDGRVGSFDLATGAPRWERKLGGAARHPLVYGDRVYVGSSDKQFYALEVKKGELAWKISVRAPLLGGAAADDAHVYFTGMDNVLRAVNRDNGGLRWRQALPFRPVAGPITIGRTVLVPGASDNLRFFDAKAGQAVKQMKLDAMMAIPPGFGTEPGETLPSIAAVTGGLADRWSLWLYGPLPPPPDGPPIEPLSALPGLLAQPGR